MNASSWQRPTVGRIGPNAIIRIAEVFSLRFGDDATVTLFVRAGLREYIGRPPQSMVLESQVLSLHRQLRESLGENQASYLAREAGVRTAMYLLEKRIPRAVQSVLKVIPAALASRVLIKAISANAWTFVGSGHFIVERDRHASQQEPIVLKIKDNPLCRGVHTNQPNCSYYAGTFEHLFRTLVHPNARVEETACEARGSEACVFEIRW